MRTLLDLGFISFALIGAQFYTVAEHPGIVAALFVTFISGGINLGLTLVDHLADEISHS